MYSSLLDLEKEGKYVFHGSPYGDIISLDLRQAKHIPDLSKPQKFILDGAPAISATPYIDFAIFKSLVNRENIKDGYVGGFGFKEGKKEFRIPSREVFDSLKDKEGFVYILDKKDFEPYSRDGNAHEGNMEWRAYQEVKPIKVIKVGCEDLYHLKPLIEFTETRQGKTY